MSTAFLIGVETFSLHYMLNAPLTPEWRAWVALARPGDSLECVTCISPDLARAIDAVREAHPDITADELLSEGAEALADDVLAFGALALH